MKAIFPFEKGVGGSTVKILSTWIEGGFRMKLSETIRKCMGWFRGRRPETDNASAAKHSADDRDPHVEDLGSALKLQEGMSAGTARLIIERFCRLEQMENCEVRDLENRGRYFRVRMAGPGGRVYRELLVDKQSGQVRHSRALANP